MSVVGAARSREKRLCACAGGAGVVRGYQPGSPAGGGEGKAGSSGQPGPPVEVGRGGRMEEAETGRGMERRRRGGPGNAEPPPWKNAVRCLFLSGFCVSRTPFSLLLAPLLARREFTNDP